MNYESYVSTFLGSMLSNFGLCVLSDLGKMAGITAASFDIDSVFDLQ